MEKKNQRPCEWRKDGKFPKFKLPCGHEIDPRDAAIGGKQYYKVRRKDDGVPAYNTCGLLYALEHEGPATDCVEWKECKEVFSPLDDFAEKDRQVWHEWLQNWFPGSLE